MINFNKKNLSIIFAALILTGFLLGFFINRASEGEIGEINGEENQLISEKELFESRINLIKTSLVNMDRVFRHSSDERIGMVEEIKEGSISAELYLPSEDGGSDVFPESWMVLEEVTILIDDSTNIFAYDFSREITRIEDTKEVRLENLDDLKTGQYVYIKIGDGFHLYDRELKAEEIRFMIFEENEE